MQSKMIQLTSAVILCLVLFGQSVIAKPGYASGYDVDYYVSVKHSNEFILNEIKAFILILDMANGQSHSQSIRHSQLNRLIVLKFEHCFISFYIMKILL